MILSQLSMQILPCFGFKLQIMVSFYRQIWSKIKRFGRKFQKQNTGSQKEKIFFPPWNSMAIHLHQILQWCLTVSYSSISSGPIRCTSSYFWMPRDIYSEGVRRRNGSYVQQEGPSPVCEAARFWWGCHCCHCHCCCSGAITKSHPTS